ncbi:protein kinase domain-containing protein [Rhodococcus opacus]|uniref:protein kinase domain-containing protein n=1 Tax=Rhodococcus opacus TaxID=37919 RepID=UPI001062C853|nr:serine/threonine-protein kinase [Rhodococcus opacus]MDV6243052.1 protein kinase [Rhodococcus opacus]
MTEFDPLATQRDNAGNITAELEAAGFTDLEEIGRGGFGVVYRCRQPHLDRTVAVKVLAADPAPEDLERFLREQRAMGRLSGHPHIVTVLQVGTTPAGRPYLVMPYHRYGSLDATIRRTGPLNWADTVNMGIALAGALETAHQAGVVHRDVKPANILLTEYGDAQLADFGIARIPGGFETGTGVITGSPAFTAPEVLAGQSPTPVSDIYSLGASLFCALTGHAAFERRSGEQLVAQFVRITTEPVPDLRDPAIPDAVTAVIGHAMATDPAARPHTAAEFADELRDTRTRAGAHADEDPPLRGPADVHVGSPKSVPVPAEPLAGTQRTRLAPPTPATKFRPPTAPKALVPRARLLDVLRAARRRRLVLIHAPAGYGKSTLAAQWREVLVAGGTVVAWLSVDNDDNNLVWFLAHLIEAIRRVQPTLGHDLGQVLEDRGDDADRYVLTSLVNEVHDRGLPVAVVIDDWHRITDSATLAALGYLLDNGCHHLQLIVTSRTRSGLPLGRMKVRDELVEVTAADLRFDLDESTRFLVDVNGLALADSELAALTRSTDGWVAALQLASLSLRGRSGAGELIAHLSGRHHAIGEFLAENVLNALEPELLDFLMATSVPERICGELAGVLADTTRGQALLEEVEERDLFLRSLDDDRDWFRYHHLFAEFLRRRLERDAPEQLARLHRKASDWFADHHALGEAVDHALAAGNDDRAVDLIESHAMSLIESSKMGTVLALVAKLPASLAQDRARLQMIVGWANVLLHRLEPMQAALTRVGAALDEHTLTEAQAIDLRVEAAVIADVGRCHADVIDGPGEQVRECLKRPDTLPPFVVAAAADVTSFADIRSFEFDAARRRQDWARRYHQQTRGPHFGMIGHCFAGIAANELLDITAAEGHFRAAWNLAVASVGVHSYAAQLSGALLGDLLYQQGTIDEAERLLDASYRLGAEGGVVDFMLASYGTGARIKVLRGDMPAAVRRLDEGADTARKLSLPRLAARIDNERIRCGVEPGIEFRTRTGKSVSEHHPSEIGTRTTELDEDSQIRMLLTAHAYDQACARVEAVVRALETARRPRVLLEARMLHARCLAAAGRVADAKQVLIPVAADCAEYGLPRLVADGGEPVTGLLTDIADDQRHGRWQPEWPSIPAPFLAQTCPS